MDLRLRLLQQALDQERPNEPGAASEQHLVENRMLWHGRRLFRREDELLVVAHHLLLGSMLFIAERRERMAQQIDGLFGSALQLLGQTGIARQRSPAE